MYASRDGRLLGFKSRQLCTRVLEGQVNDVLGFICTEGKILHVTDLSVICKR